MLRILALKTTRLWILVVALSGASISMVSADSSRTDSRTEVNAAQQAITQLIDQFVASWNLHDAKKLSELFAVDGDFIGITGSKWDSPAKIYQVHSELFKGRYDKSVYAISGVPQINLVSPDVAIVHWRWSIKDVRDDSGKVMPPYSGIFTWVLVRNNSNWKVRSAQNNTITQS
ncbi:SgcJ/EcaC family oxidoreductase [Pseudomonas sp. TAE6080]|uniref:SgcJ/EcaC family oxidoreductase n=1 Tax=Pseudomonas sp. TAE6080 TaxID=2840374 RepID=UPI001C008A59|nr:SgcJ/EcaC family oxidoreductase [Pseudomonas sp. TAE6080]